MDDNSRDVERILMHVKNATLLMDPIMKLMGVGTIMLFTLMGRMVREKMMDKRDFAGFQNFAKMTEGNYTIINIPVVADKDALGKAGEDMSYSADILAELDKMDILYNVMPDLDRNDGFIQVAVAGKDKEKFAAWYEGYLSSKMRGGEHEQKDLRNLTGNKTSIISVPLEGKEELFRADFQALEINYAILPDLNVGDGEIQMVIANTDMPKVEHWYGLYREDMLKKGEEVPELSHMDMASYTRTGEMTEQEYVDGASEPIKEMNEKYDRDPGELEKRIIGKENLIKSENSQAYQDYESNPAYQKLTINRDTLVDKDGTTASKIAAEMEEKGYFASRVPGTYGRSEQVLLVPLEDAFLSLDQKTYTVFLDRRLKPLVLDSSAKPIKVEDRLNATELFKRHYDLSHREEDLTQRIRSSAKMPEKIPAAPAKR